MSKPSSKKAALSQALRANLAKRKAQARTQSSPKKPSFSEESAEGQASAELSS